ncbi:hypothetical protein [Ferrimonas balearica]|uniref:hypothetical protein n=1 Tax=Ferrimonas balearica TaxID=44012 RepID=UPI001C9A1D98|nr:hypothetical protein [Ferrimonas balearica]MBY5993605.1 hypothetical protein [Ferrimonas balearica]
MKKTLTAFALTLALAACGSSDDQHRSYNEPASNQASIEQTAAVAEMAQPAPAEESAPALSPELDEMANAFGWQADDLVDTCLDQELPEIHCALRYSEDSNPHDVAVISGELATAPEQHNGSGSLEFELRTDEVTRETRLELSNHTWDRPVSCDTAHVACDSIYILVKADGSREELGRAQTNEALAIELDEKAAALMDGTTRLEIEHFEGSTHYSTDAFVTPNADFVAAMGRMRRTDADASGYESERRLAD